MKQQKQSGAQNCWSCYSGIVCLLQPVPDSTVSGRQCTTQDENQSSCNPPCRGCDCPPPCLPAMPTPIAEGAMPPITLATSMQTRDRLSNTPILSHSLTRDVAQECRSSTASTIIWDSSCACQGMAGLISEAWHWAWHTSCSPAQVPSSPSPKTLPSKHHHPHLMKVVKYVLCDHNWCGIYLEWAAGSTTSLRCGLPPYERSRSLGNFQKLCWREQQQQMMARTCTYAHPHHMKVVIHLICVWLWCKI